MPFDRLDLWRGGEVVCLVCDDVWSFDLGQALDAVSAERRRKALGYRFERDRRLSVAAYRLLQAALAVRFGLGGRPVFAFGPNGKPYLPEHPRVHFSLSHCARAAACAVSAHPVGLDAETVSTVNPAVARFVLSEDERAAVAADAHPEIAFARYWTMKEALAKLSGEGLSDEKALPRLLSRARSVSFATCVRGGGNYVVTLAQERQTNRKG